jgi:hypothetical protein
MRHELVFRVNNTEIDGLKIVEKLINEMIPIPFRSSKSLMITSYTDDGLLEECLYGRSVKTKESLTNNYNNVSDAHSNAEYITNTYIATNNLDQTGELDIISNNIKYPYMSTTSIKSNIELIEQYRKDIEVMQNRIEKLKQTISSQLNNL